MAAQECNTTYQECMDHCNLQNDSACSLLKPNLTPHQPVDWSDKIVVSSITGTSTDAAYIYETDTIYIDWAVLNDSDSDAGSFTTSLYVDGALKYSWSHTSGLQGHYYSSVEDYSIGTLSAGTHTITIVADSGETVSESNESDNQYVRQVTVLSIHPNITPYQPAGWSDKIVVSTTTETNTDASVLSETDTIYVDWAIINDSGNDAGSFTTSLYVDGALKHSWNHSGLQGHYYSSVEDYNIGSLSAGEHEIKIIADPTSVVDESNELDNEFVKTITVVLTDLCPSDPNKTEPGQCGCNTPDTDTDGDSVADCNDQCADTDPSDPSVDQIGCADSQKDCNGTPGGTAVEDNCGVCDTDPSNDCTQDCAGTWGGTAAEDNCAVCDTDPSNDCTEDCAGTWGGTAVEDNCGTCDTDPNNDCTQDPILPGDQNNDGIINLSDVVLALQIITYTPSPVPVFKEADINGDGKIGLEEALEALQVSSELKAQPSPPPGTVVSAGGRIWMDRNLGASQVATSSTDQAAYGDLYQWGRSTDGHQLRTSHTTTITSSTDDPGHADFILSSDDWRVPHNNNLWQGVSGINNPCPAGFRLPTATELTTERVSWASNDSEGAFGSPLKLVLAGFRFLRDGTEKVVGTEGSYWSSLTSTAYVTHMSIGTGYATMYSEYRGDGPSVRCIMD